MGSLSEASDFTLELTNEHALMRLDNRVGLPPIGEDYQTCGLVACLLARWPTELTESLDVWFRRKVPSELGEYRRLLGGTRLHFEAGVSGFSFPAQLLDRALVSTRRRATLLVGDVVVGGECERAHHDLEAHARL
jgi:hypothetical protein